MKELIDWIVNTINFLIFIYIFLKTLGTKCFNTFDLFVSLFGITIGVIALIMVIINKYEGER